VLSLDVAGGLARTQSLRREALTANLLEKERERFRFLSLHAAIQADVWRRLFVSGSLLSITQSRLTDSSLFTDQSGRRLTNDGPFTDFFATAGIGWRFRRNLLAEYIFTTDFGQTTPRHTLLLRYTFNFGDK
jgi:hypothetical protein